MRWPALVMSFCIATLSAGAAHADKMAETLDISLSPRFAWLQIHRPLTVAPSAEGTDVLLKSRPHLSGEGVLMGSTIRLGATLDGVRFGFGTGIVSAPGLNFVHAPLGDGLSAEPGTLWGSAFEGYLGYTIGDPRELRGIIEARGALTVLQTRVTTRDVVLGTLGETPLNAYLGNLELRAALRIPVDTWLYIEPGVGVSPLPNDLSPERGSVFVNVGLPVPFANAF